MFKWKIGKLAKGGADCKITSGYYTGQWATPVFDDAGEWQHIGFGFYWLVEKK